MKTVCPFCGAYRYDSQQMSGIFRPYSYKIYYTKNRRGVQFPRSEKKKKAPELPRVLAPSQTPRTQSVRYFRPNLPSARRADRPAAAGRIKFPIKVQLCRTFIPLPAPQRRGRPCRAGARGVSFSVSPEPKTYPGGTASPLESLSRATLPHARPCAAARAAA